ALAPLLLVPLGVVHWAQRAYAETRADRTRLESLHKATQTLAGPIDPADAVPAFLGLVRSCFEAIAADLVFLAEPERVHHRREARAAWLQQAAHRSGIVERAADGIFTIGPDGSLGTWNPAMEQITGFPSADVAGSRGLALLRPHGPDGEEVAFDTWLHDDD